MPDDIGFPLGMWTSLYWDLSAEDALRHVAERGWKYVDLSAEHMGELTRAEDPGRVDRVRELAEGLGITLWQCHGFMDLKLAAADEALRSRSEQALAGHLHLAERLGVGTVVVHPSADDTSNAEAVHERLRESLGRLAPVAQDTGVRIAVENMMKKGFGVDPANLVGLAEAVDPQCIGICFDTSHANAGEVDSAEGIRTCGKSLFALHLSDNDGSGDQHRPPYFGSVDWPAVLSALRDVEFPGPLTFEVPYLSPWPRPVRDGVFGFIETAMRYAAGADETDASHRQQVARDVSRRARMDPENSPLAVH